MRTQDSDQDSGLRTQDSGLRTQDSDKTKPPIWQFLQTGGDSCSRLATQDYV